MPIRTKWGGSTWQSPAADGNIRLKWGGTGWYNPAYVRFKVSDGATPANNGYGTNPRWVDPGYRGIPNPPDGTWIHSWDYGQVTHAYNPPSSGPAVATYNFVKTDQYGNWLESVEDTNWHTFGVSQDTRYRFYVRSKGVNGLYSKFVPEPEGHRVGIGHPETYNYGWVQRTKPWQGQLNGGVWARDQWIAMIVPNNVWIDNFQVNLYTPQDQWMYSQTRQMYYILGNNQGEQIYAPSPWYETVWWSLGWGGDLYWGMVARGSGWGTSNAHYMIHGDMWINGTDYYNNWEIVSTNPAQGNYWW